MPLARLDDVDLYYELVDCTEPWRPAVPPLLFIHGLGGDHTMWFYQVAAFCTRFPVLTFDLRGHGRSTRPDTPFGMADFARDAAGLLRVLGFDRAHVVGLSLGGMVAQQLALAHAEVVTSVVIADSLCGVPPEFEAAMRTALRFIEENDMRTVARARITNAFSDQVNPALREHVIDLVARNDKRCYEHSARAAMGFACGEQLSGVRAPALVLVAEEDRVTPPALSDMIAARLPNARLVRLPRGGHINNMECPQEFNRAVGEFLDHVQRR